MMATNIIEPPPHKHFNGWVSIIDSLSKVFTRKDFVLHPFLDRDTLFFFDNLKVLKGKPWMGIVHFPTHGAPLLHPEINSINVVKKINSSEYKDHCNGLIVLTNKAKETLSKFTDIPIYRLWHPKFVGKNTFDITSYFRNPIIRHPGKAYRDFCPYFKFNTKLKKEIHIEPQNKWLINQTLELSGELVDDSVSIKTKFLKEKKYIKNLTTSIGFGYWFDCEASNSILEHLMTHTPIIANRLPSIVEYLGKHYPMYYDDIKIDPDKFLLDKKFIKEVSSYLKDRSSKKRFTVENFCKQINNLP